MDTSTLIVVFLLVTAASLASYALSHWSSARGAVNMGWAATSLGTTMLLVAAAIVVLTFVFRGPLWRPNLGDEQQGHERAAAASEETSARRLNAPSVPSGTAGTTVASANAAAPNSRDRQGADDSSVSTVSEPQPSTVAVTPSRTNRGSPPAAASRNDDPWAATRCVHVYHPGSDLTEWKIDNDCDLPVGVMVSGCDANTGPCGPMIFPSKQQRPIPLEEQIVYGANIRHIACFAVTESVIYLIAAPSEERATDTWRERFAAARASDSCLLQIQN